MRCCVCHAMIGDDEECVRCGTTVSEMDDMCQTQEEMDPELEEEFDE